MVLFFRARNLVQRQSSRTWKERQKVLMVVTIISRYLRPLKNIMLEINIATGLVLFYVKGYKQNVDNIWSNFGQHTLLIIHKGNDTNQCIYRRENTRTFMAFTSGFFFEQNCKYSSCKKLKKYITQGQFMLKTQHFRCKTQTF